MKKVNKVLQTRLGNTPRLLNTAVPPPSLPTPPYPFIHRHTSLCPRKNGVSVQGQRRSSRTWHRSQQEEWNFLYSQKTNHICSYITALKGNKPITPSSLGCVLAVEQVRPAQDHRENSLTWFVPGQRGTFSLPCS